MGRDEWLARLRKFGVAVDHRTLLVPDAEAGEVRRLVEAG
jgi:hypothetical protein